VIGALTDQPSIETAVIAEITTDRRGALERVEGESPLPYRHQTLCRAATVTFCRDNRTDPTTL
jgi:hypothetical protein